MTVPSDACKDGAPSTWILKRAEHAGSPLADIVDTEVACLDLARRVGLTTIRAEVIDLACRRWSRRPTCSDWTAAIRTTC